MIGLGNDPGTANSGYTVLDFTKKDFKFLEVGQIESTFNNLKAERDYKKITKAVREKAKKKGIRLKKTDMPFRYAFHEGLPIYINAMDKLFNDYRIGFYVAERFQVRAITQGPTVEMVSMMNGIVCHMCLLRQIQYRLVIASQWKNAINKIINLEEMYAFAKKEGGFSPHECDSTGMALYQADKLGVLPLKVGLSKWRKNLSVYSKQN